MLYSVYNGVPTYFDPTHHVILIDVHTNPLFLDLTPGSDLIVLVNDTLNAFLEECISFEIECGERVFCHTLHIHP